MRGLPLPESDAGCCNSGRILIVHHRRESNPTVAESNGFFIALGSGGSKMWLLQSAVSPYPRRTAFSVKVKCRLLHPATDTDSDLPPPGITRVSLNREHYYANPNPLAVSASKNGRTSFGYSRPRRRFPSAASGHYTPTGLGRTVLSN